MATESARDDRPRKKKKKKKSNAGLWIGLGIGGGVLLVILIGIGVVVALRPWERGGEKKNDIAQNPQPQQPQQQPPNNKLGGDVVREPKTVLGNMRARVNRTEADNEMKQISLFFHQYADLHKNPKTRTLDGFLDFLKRDSNLLYNKIKVQKYYTMNLLARLGSEDILVYETEEWTNGYYCFHANNQMGYLPAQELKAAGLLAPAAQDQKK
jgi:hypothetical protein